MRDFIDIHKREEGLKKSIKVFFITEPSQREEYEELLNNEFVNILSETLPTADKAGRVFITVT